MFDTVKSRATAMRDQGDRFVRRLARFEWVGQGLSALAARLRIRRGRGPEAG